MVICSAIGAHSVNKEDRSGANAGGCNLHGIAFKVGSRRNGDGVACVGGIGVGDVKEVACGGSGTEINIHGNAGPGRSRIKIKHPAIGSGGSRVGDNHVLHGDIQRFQGHVEDIPIGGRAACGYFKHIALPVAGVRIDINDGIREGAVCDDLDHVSGGSG